MKLRHIPILALIGLIVIVMILFLIQNNSQNKLLEKQRQVIENMSKDF